MKGLRVCGSSLAGQGGSTNPSLARLGICIPGPNDMDLESTRGRILVLLTVAAAAAVSVWAMSIAP
jgi:hypothetical protein